MYRLSKIAAGCRPRLRARIGLALALSLSAPLSAQAAELQGMFGGHAYGLHSQTNVAALNTALNRVGLVSLGCTGSEGQTIFGTVAQLAVPGMLSADTVANTAFSKRTATSAVARDVSTITGLSAFGGLITADAIKAEARVGVTPGSMVLMGDASAFTNLRIAGQLIAANVPPNTKVALPGLGTATLRQTTKTGGGGQDSGSIRVEMLVIDITSSNPFALAAGSKITVASAFSRFERGAFSVSLGGEAFGAIATGNASKALRTRIGSIASVSAGCRGSGGRTVTASSGGVDGGTSLSSGTATSTGVAGPSGGAIVSRFISKVQNVSMLGGTVQVGSVRVAAHDVVRNGKRASAADAEFSSLHINGQEITNPTPNTRVEIPGIGFVVVNEQVVPPPSSRRPTEVNGVHLYITADNPFGLPIGTQLVVGHAKSLAFPVPTTDAGT